MLIINHSNPFN